MCYYEHNISKMMKNVNMEVLMEYEVLSKLFYKDAEVYKQTYQQRFNLPGTIKLDFDIAGNQAFFVQDNEVIKLVYDILRLDKKIALLCRKLPRRALLQYSRKCLIDEIVLTNDIEGVHSSRKEIGEALNVLESQSEAKAKKTRFVGLVNKYLKLNSGEKVPLETCEDVRKLYDEIILTEVKEEDSDNIPDGKIFRKDKTSVFSATGTEIHPGMTPESKIIEYMTKALDFLNNSDIENLYRICLFHYMIGYIHPFYDGNGRLGRFTLSYCVSQSLEAIWAYRISEIIKEHRKEYYKAFEICNNPRNLGDLTPFLIMMLQVIYVSGLELYNSLEEKKLVWDRYRGMIPYLDKSDEKAMTDLYGLLIQAAMFGEEGIPTMHLLGILEIGRAALKSKLEIIRAQELLIEKKRDKTKFYQINIQKMDELYLKQK